MLERGYGDVVSHWFFRSRLCEIILQVCLNTPWPWSSKNLEFWFGANAWYLEAGRWNILFTCTSSGTCLSRCNTQEGRHPSGAKTPVTETHPAPVNYTYYKSYILGIFNLCMFALRLYFIGLFWSVRSLMCRDLQIRQDKRIPLSVFSDPQWHTCATGQWHICVTGHVSPGVWADSRTPNPNS